MGEPLNLADIEHLRRLLRTLPFTPGTPGSYQQVIHEADAQKIGEAIDVLARAVRVLSTRLAERGGGGEDLRRITLERLGLSDPQMASSNEGTVYDWDRDFHR